MVQRKGKKYSELAMLKKQQHVYGNLEEILQKV